VIQQAIAQELSPLYEPQFAETSYGFRPKRSAHDALRKCKEYANQGYTYVVDMDLEKFFDTVNQSKMIEILSRTINDSRVLSLIHKYLIAGAMNKGRFEETKLGLVQGGNVSPLCSNIMLNELDHELERRGIRFVRYADDLLLFAKTKRSAQRILEHIIPYIESKLLLRVNKEKTVVAYIGKVVFCQDFGQVKSKHNPFSLLSTLYSRLWITMACSLRPAFIPRFLDMGPLHPLDSLVTGENNLYGVFRPQDCTRGCCPI
jgi:RNA-directed DNA polymerase